MFCEFAWMVVPQASNSNTLMAVLMPAPEVTGPRTPPKGRTLLSALARLFGLRVLPANRIQKTIFLYCTKD
jgi:hypothetical protein